MANQRNSLRATLLATIAVGSTAYFIGFLHGGATDKNRDSTLTSQFPPETEEPSSQTNPLAETTAENPNKTPTPSTPKQPPAVPPPINHTDQGFRDAALSLEDSLLYAESLNGRSRQQYLLGVFSQIASTQTPEEALRIAQTQAPSVRQIGLKALASSWVSQNESLSPDQRDRLQNRILRLGGGRLGLEVELASILGQQNVGANITDAWLTAHASHPGRSEMQARFAAGGSAEQIERAIAQSRSWTPWEQANFSESLVYQWTLKDPSQAWNWYSENNDRFSTDHTTQLLETWASRQPESLASRIDQLPPGQKETAIEALAGSLARRGTEQAIDWANGLANTADQDIAYEAIYQATPKGIGASVAMQNGFPQIRDLIPGGALENTGVLPGDLLVEASEDGRETRSLYGQRLPETIAQLRGNPGSSLRLKFLRPNPDTGQLEQFTTTVVRDLLILGPTGDG